MAKHFCTVQAITEKERVVLWDGESLDTTELNNLVASGYHYVDTYHCGCGQNIVSGSYHWIADRYSLAFRILVNQHLQTHNGQTPKQIFTDSYTFVSRSILDGCLSFKVEEATLDGTQH